MSDATPPPPHRLSSATATASRIRSDSSSGDGEFETCLDQSARYFTRREGLVDSEGRADNKQKRKRTSPADQAILEAEYKQNPKPDKAVRTKIVERVSLNEKEVQIWFQNRRQINRRKLGPLQPHEIAAFGLGGLAALSSDPASMVAYSSSPSMEETESSSQVEVVASQGEPESRLEDIPEVSLSKPVEILEVEKEMEAELEVEVEVEAEALVEEVASALPPTLLHRASSGISVSEPSSLPIPETTANSCSSTPGYLANRRNTSPSSSQLPAFTTPTIYKAPQPNSCPGRVNETASSSNVRLSLSLDGKAELISTTPSPPRRYAPRPLSSSASMFSQRRMGIQRSQSAISLGPRPSMANPVLSLMPRLPTGRSRDARAWETCCDGEPRDELIALAENESQGSAVAAISLIRSSSNAALKANPNKRNAPAAKHDAVKQGKKQKLGKAMSSLARLQTPIKTSSQVAQDPSEFTKGGLLRSPSGDSDKENWVLREGGGNAPRRPLPSSRLDSKQPRSRVVLGENNNIPSHADFGVNRNRKRKPAGEQAIFEDSENTAEVGKEVEQFMRGEVSPSKKGDLDCIQGLLSLSQGNWR